MSRPWVGEVAAVLAATPRPDAELADSCLEVVAAWVELCDPELLLGQLRKAERFGRAVGAPGAGAARERVLGTLAERGASPELLSAWTRLLAETTEEPQSSSPPR